jgi:hypothetical protein
MRWAGHVAGMGEGRGVYRFLVRKPEGKGHLVDSGVDGSLGSGTWGHVLDRAGSG